MGNAVLSWVNYVDRAQTSITASSQAGALGPGNLANRSLRARWRTAPAVTSPNLSFDFGSALPLQVIAYVQPSDAGGFDANGTALGWMAATDTVRNRLDAVTPGAGVLLDSGVVAGGWVPGYGIYASFLAASLTARYLRTDFAAASLVATPGYIDLGRAWVGPAFQVPSNFTLGWGHGWVDASNVIVNPRSGLELVDTKFKTRIASFTFDTITDADAVTHLELQRIAGVSGQVLLIPDPDSAYKGYRAILGRLTEVPQITQPFAERFRASFTITATL